MTPLHRLAALLPATLVALLVLAPAALAADGEGTYGRTTDKVITYFSFGVMVFFTVLVIVLSYVQGKLESRKERVRADIERLRQP